MIGLNQCKYEVDEHARELDIAFLAFGSFRAASSLGLVSQVHLPLKSPMLVREDPGLQPSLRLLLQLRFAAVLEDSRLW